MTMPSTLLKPLSTSWTPHAYQKKSVRFLLEHAAAALLLDPGLGKTSVTLAAIQFLLKRKVLSKVLLVAPLRVCYSVWPRETEKWTDFHGLRLALLHGKGKEAALASDADVYLINPEGLEWLLQLEKTRTPAGKVRVTLDLKRWRQLGFDTLVIDELSKFKHPGTVRYKAMKLVLGTFARRWGLTGSPAPNGLMDLFGQCYMLDQGNALGLYVTHFRLKYFEPARDGFTWFLRKGADEEIYARLRPLAMRMAAEDYLEMPALVENNIRVDLPEAAMRMHDQLKEDLLAKLDSGVITAANAAVASGKCRQVANGAIYKDQDVVALLRLPTAKREYVALHDAKLDALADLIDELQGSPLLVAYDFNHDLERLKERFGVKGELHYIGGGVAPKRAAELERAWNAGELPVLFGHPQSIAHGLNLQEVGNHVCWFGLTWDYELYDQFIRRVRRQGNKAKRVFVHHLLARGTIDETVLAALKSKRHGQQALFDALRSMRRK